MRLRLLILLFLVVFSPFACSGQDLDKAPTNEVILKKHLADNHIKKRFKYKTNCKYLTKELLEIETYDSLGNILKLQRLDNKTTHLNFYDKKGLLEKILHLDSVGNLTAFNLITYRNEKFKTNTLYNADSTVKTVYERYPVYKQNYDSITWKYAVNEKKLQDGGYEERPYNSVQCMKYDRDNFLIENGFPYNTSGWVERYHYKNGLLILTEYSKLNKETGVDKLISKEIYEYDIDSLPVKIIYYQAGEPQCTYYFSYVYEKQ
jgi:hypothetical protein